MHLLGRSGTSTPEPGWSVGLVCYIGDTASAHDGLVGAFGSAWFLSICPLLNNLTIDLCIVKEKVAFRRCWSDSETEASGLCLLFYSALSLIHFRYKIIALSFLKCLCWSCWWSSAISSDESSNGLLFQQQYVKADSSWGEGRTSEERQHGCGFTAGLGLLPGALVKWVFNSLDQWQRPVPWQRVLSTRGHHFCRQTSCFTEGITVLCTHSISTSITPKDLGLPCTVSFYSKSEVMLVTGMQQVYAFSFSWLDRHFK